MNATGSGPVRADRENADGENARCASAYGETAGRETADRETAARERAERDELAQLLPVLPERELPAGRHLHHKERLMQLIDDDRTRPATAATTAPAPALARRLRAPARPALWMPAAAAALAGALAVTLTGGPGTASAPPAGNSAVVLLNRIADVAAKSEATPVRDDQLVYVRSLVAAAEGEWGGKLTLGPLHQREVWMSQRPGPMTKKVGLIHEDGDYFPLNEMETPGSPGVPAGIERPTYRWLASLPTDPDELLKELYRLTKPVEGQEKAQAVFDQIGELLDETVMPPRNAAALYEAAAKLPGVKRADDAVDAAGRHGVAIARVDRMNSWATEWIFDKDTLTYLGERTYLTKDTTSGRKGAVMDETAVLKRGIVDEYRRRPGSGQ